MANAAQQSIKAISARARFIAKMQLLPTPAQSLHQPHQNVGAVLDNTVIPDLPASPVFSNRH
jgi:hypothetical protein